MGRAASFIMASAVLLSALVVLAPKTSDLHCGPAQGNLVVTVVDAAMSAPIVGANVSIQGAQTGWNTTGTDGNWTFYDIRAGSYTATASMTGYLPNSTLVYVYKDQTAHCVLSLQAVPTSNQGNLAATVLDAATQNAIVGANVSVQGPEIGWNTTGIYGNWTFYNIEAGTYTVTASMTGYLSNTTLVVVYQGQTTDCTLSLQTVPVPNQGNLTVTVIDAATSNPIVGANVSIQGPETDWNLTGSSGNWTFYNVEAGNYGVTASVTGYLSNSTPAVVYQGQMTSCVLSLQSVPVSNQGNLTVTVVDAANQNPIVTANVSIQGPEAHWNTTGPNGDWTFYNIEAGSYSVNATMTGYLPNSTLAVVDQDQTTNCVLSLQAVPVPNQGNLTVTVVDSATENPIVGANVSIQGPEADWNTTGTGGNWTFYNVEAGSYAVTASVVGYLSNSTSAVVHQGQTTNCILSLQIVPVPEQGNLTATVVDAVTQNPIVGANVSIQGPETDWNLTTSSGNWTFFNLEAGTYTVTATITGYLSNSTSATVSQGATTNCTLILQPVPMPDRGNLTVSVVDAVTQDPIVGARVSIQGPETRWNTTGSDGNWTFYNVEVGSYTVIVSLAGYLPNSTVVVVYKDQTTSFVLSLQAGTLRDVAVVDVVPDADWVYRGKLCHAGVNVTVVNLGEVTESFTVSLYALNDTANPSNVTIGTVLVENLPPNETLVLRFVWNSQSAQPSCWYNITAVASTVSGEVDVMNNVKSSLTLVKVRLFGDVNDDDRVNVLDAIAAAISFGSSSGDPNYNPAADVNNDGTVNIFDLILVAGSFRYVGPDL